MKCPTAKVNAMNGMMQQLTGGVPLRPVPEHARGRPATESQSPRPASVLARMLNFSHPQSPREA